MPSGLDQSWGFADPEAAARAGVRVVSMYLSWSPSKNATAAKIRAYHAAGIGVLLNWESQAGAPLDGAARGHEHATEAVRQIRELIREIGRAPRNKLAIPFSCDTDTSAAQRSGPVRHYYANTKTITHAAGFLNGCYGEADLCDYLHAQGLTDMEWQTYAWSYGRISPEADFYQYDNGEHLGGASVDFDRVIHAAQVGAWWPNRHPLNKPTTDVLEDDMPLNDADKKWLTSMVSSQAAAAVRENVMDAVVPLTGKVNGHAAKPTKLGHLLSVWHGAILRRR